MILLDGYRQSPPLSDNVWIGIRVHTRYFFPSLISKFILITGTPGNGGVNAQTCVVTHNRARIMQAVAQTRESDSVISQF